MSRIPLSSQLSFRLVTAASDNGRTVKQFQLALHGQLQDVVVFRLRGTPRTLNQNSVSLSWGAYLSAREPG